MQQASSPLAIYLLRSENRTPWSLDGSLLSPKGMTSEGPDLCCQWAGFLLFLSKRELLDRIMSIDRNASISEIQRWKDYSLLSIESEALSRNARPGQFLMIKVSDTSSPLLRRPFSIHDARKTGVDVFFKVAGAGTAILAEKEQGGFLDIIGPLGKGYTVSPDLRGKKAFCIGGGRGIAPLFFLGRELEASGADVTVFYGGQTREDIPLREKFERGGFHILCSTDDGSFGFKGFVTELLDDIVRNGAPDAFFACGPDPMMKAIAGLAERLKIFAEFSLESMMGCGIGACWGCVHRIKSDDGEGWLKICEEGPVFSGDRIVWTD